MVIELTTNVNVPTDASLSITVYEDVDGDGAAENSETVSVPDGVETQALTSINGDAGNDVWPVPEASTSAEFSPGDTIDSIEITPVAPKNLTATQASDSQNDLTWDDTGDEDGYAIYRAQSTGSTLADYTQIDTVGQHVTTYSDSGLENGERYYYRVTATYSDGSESDPSNEDDATTTVPIPTIDGVDTSVEDEITVTYSLPDNSSDGSVEIYRSENGSLGTQIDTVSDLSATSYTDSNQEDGEQYHYTVRRVTDHAQAETQQAAISLLPAPTLDAATVQNVTEIAADWTKTDDSSDGESELQLSTDGGATWSIAVDGIAPSTTSATASGLRHGEQYNVRIVRKTDHATATSNTLQRTTDLPDEDQPALGNGVEDEVSVDRETAPTNNGDVRIQIRETGKSSWDANAIGFAEQVLDHATLTTQFSGREDGEEYEVRVRTETEHVTGTWTSPVAIITQYPGAANLSLTVAGADQIDGQFDDNSDNEDGVEVWVAEELDPRRDTGFGSFTLDQTLPPNTTTFSVTGLKPNHDYLIYVRSFTDDASADSATKEATTDLTIPSKGWYVVLDDGTGDLITVSPRAIDEKRPILQPEEGAVGRWEIDLAPDATYHDWLGGEAYIYYDADLWMRGPTTRYHPDGGDDSASAMLVGLDIVEHLKAGGTAFDVTSEPGYEALERFVNQNLPEWTIDVTPPGTQLVDEDFLVQNAATDAELESIFGTPDATDIWTIDNGLKPKQTAWTVEGENWDSGLDSGEGGLADEFSGGVAATFNGDGSDDVSYQFTTNHDIPEQDVSIYLRLDTSGSDTPEVAFELDGTEIDLFPAGGTIQSPTWFDIADGQFGGGGYTGGTLTAGTHTLRIVGKKAGAQLLEVDVVAPADNRFNHTLDNDNGGNGGYLDGPEHYRPVQITATAFSQDFNVVKAQIDTVIDDVSGGQSLQATNDGGTTWLPTGGSEQNTQSVTADFAAAPTYGTAVQGRTTLGGHGSRTDATPQEDYQPQTLTEWELRIDTNALRVIDDQTYTGSPYDIIDAVAEDSGLLWVPDYREDQLHLNAFEPGGETRSVDWTIVDDDPVDTTEGYFNTITVFGPEQDDGTRLSATASSNSAIDERGEVPGPAEFRPDATTKAELTSIARTRLAQGLAKDTVTGTTTIEAQFVQPGYAYSVAPFAAIDDRTDPTYVLESARFKWGEMTLDFEARSSLARAMRSIETEIRTTKRAL